MKPTLVLTLTTSHGERCIHIVCLNPTRLTQYGFGLFLENVDPQEVTAGKGVIAALLEQPERRGLQGMEFWADNRLAFCAIIVPLSQINVPTAAKIWIKQFVAAPKSS